MKFRKKKKKIQYTGISLQLVLLLAFNRKKAKRKQKRANKRKQTKNKMKIKVLRRIELNMASEKMFFFNMFYSHNLILPYSYQNQIAHWHLPIPPLPVATHTQSLTYAPYKLQIVTLHTALTTNLCSLSGWLPLPLHS